jgi:hypothetical protein
MLIIALQLDTVWSIQPGAGADLTLAQELDWRRNLIIVFG